MQMMALFLSLVRERLPAMVVTEFKGCGIGDSSRRVPLLGGMGMLTAAGIEDGGTSDGTRHWPVGHLFYM